MAEYPLRIPDEEYQKLQHKVIDDHTNIRQVLLQLINLYLSGKIKFRKGKG